MPHHERDYQMAKAPKVQDSATETVAKKTKVRRYRAHAEGTEFMLPSGGWILVKTEDFHPAADAFCLTYGRGQKWADAVFATGKEEAPPTDEDAMEVIESFRDGTLGDRSRGPGDGRPTLASVVRGAVMAAAKKKGEKLTPDDVKTRIGEIMSTPERLAKANVALAARLAEWEALDI